MIVKTIIVVASTDFVALLRRFMDSRECVVVTPGAALTGLCAEEVVITCFVTDDYLNTTLETRLQPGGKIRYIFVGPS